MYDEKEIPVGEEQEPEVKEPEKFTFEEWSKKCAFAVLPTVIEIKERGDGATSISKMGPPYIVFNPGLVPAHTLYGELSQHMATLQAALTVQIMLDSMNEARRQSDIHRQLSMPNGAPVKGMGKR